jgi:hypothetical protein
MTIQNDALIPEWERINQLCNCVVSIREGLEISDVSKHNLKNLQNVVNLTRTKAPWNALIRDFDLDRMEQDILACVIAPEATPEIGWAYQDLQPGVAGNFPSPALIRELLFIDNNGMDEFYSRITKDAPLMRSGLIDGEIRNSYDPLRPGSKAINGLLGLGLTRPKAPPGTIDITAPAGWDDLVLPEYCISALNDFRAWVEHRDTVIGEWGGQSTGGPVALFSGPSGTGKTYTARVIANSFGWPLYRVDVGLLVSKYVGETEKNLNALFDEANGKAMVLLFDEAESIFGKRADVKDARDRYANMEISHLLSRIEYHDGPCILTTNLKKQLDPAFARRFQLVLDFPLPDKAARTKLWQKHLPPRAPLTADVDPNILGESISMTGGQIRNAALQAAFLSAASSAPISLKTLARAIWMEMNKGGREVMASNLGPLSCYLEREISHVEH